jgi:predicted ATP-grasp superfamily ATP-dependent carboligase
MPPQSSYKGLGMTKYSGPAIRMEEADHTELWSTDSFRESTAWQMMQRDLVSQGRIDKALQNDINDVVSRFPGKYDDAINQLLDSLPNNVQYQTLRTVPSPIFFQMALF